MLLKHFHFINQPLALSLLGRLHACAHFHFQVFVSHDIYILFHDLNFPIFTLYILFLIHFSLHYHFPIETVDAAMPTLCWLLDLHALHHSPPPSPSPPTPPLRSSISKNYHHGTYYNPSFSPWPWLSSATGLPFLQITI